MIRGESIQFRTCLNCRCLKRFWLIIINPGSKTLRVHKFKRMRDARSGIRELDELGACIFDNRIGVLFMNQGSAVREDVVLRFVQKMGGRVREAKHFRRLKI